MGKLLRDYTANGAEEALSRLSVVFNKQMVGAGEGLGEGNFLNCPHPNPLPQPPSVYLKVSARWERASSARFFVQLPSNSHIGRYTRASSAPLNYKNFRANSSTGVTVSF